LGQENSFIRVYFCTINTLQVQRVWTNRERKFNYHKKIKKNPLKKFGGFLHAAVRNKNISIEKSYFVRAQALVWSFFFYFSNILKIQMGGCLSFLIENVNISISLCVFENIATPLVQKFLKFLIFWPLKIYI
jgi:hypothetical protein